MLKANRELSKSAAVFDNVPEVKVKQYFKDLAGIDELPSPHRMSTAHDINGKPGIRYTVEKDCLIYNLRSGSSTVDKTGAKWTIEINGVSGYPVGDRVINRKKIEIKFR